MKIKITLLALFATLHFASAQRATEFRTRLSTIRSSEYTEKVYLHIDRTFYLTGETIWWKAYVLNMETQQGTELSKIGYIEILDGDNIPVIQTKFGITNGSSNGGLFVPASLNSGHYRLVAYTRWMQNQPSEYFFSQNITIVNPFRKATRSTTTGTELSVQFLPEGGNLVYGVKSEIAAKGLIPGGQSASYQGVVVNHLNDTIVRFQSLKFGLSSFEFTPISGQSYRALARTRGKWVEVPFPSIEPKGPVLHVTNDGTTMTANIRTLNEIGNTYIFTVHHRLKTKWIHTVTIRGNEESFSVPYDSLGDGVNHLTLFNAASTALAERLVFKHAPIQNLALQTDAIQYGSRKKVTVHLDKAAPLQGGDFSVAVSKVDSLGLFAKANINEYLLLTSDLSGKIESPGWFFSKPDAEKNALLDLVLKTHGWTRFSWSNALSSKSDKTFLPEYRGHLLFARVTDEKGNPAVGISTFFAVPGKTIRFYPAVSDATGHMKVELKPFFGTRKLISQTDFRRDTTFTITLQPPYAKHQVTPLPPFSLHPKVTPLLLERSVAMQSASVFAKLLPPPPEQDSTTFYGEPDEKYLLDDYTRFPVLEEVLREYVAGIWVRKRAGQFYFQMPDKITGKMLAGEPMVLLDGVPVFSINRLMEVDAIKVKQIDVVSRPYFLNGASFEGIASFRTYDGNMGNFVTHPKALSIDFDGLAVKKEYYVPTYRTVEEAESRIPDRRTLLYWQPQLQAGTNEDQVFSFFTSDIKGRFMVDIQGIDSNGKPVSLSTFFDVN